jgi:pimeloyl-ACP methyl ester carboxylesterase
MDAAQPVMEDAFWRSTGRCIEALAATMADFTQICDKPRIVSLESISHANPENHCNRPIGHAHSRIPGRKKPIALDAVLSPMFRRTAHRAVTGCRNGRDDRAGRGGTRPVRALTEIRRLARGKVALLLHGTLSHRDTEIIQSLETLLGDEGVSTLAVNLSLGVRARDGAFDCGAEHRHREQDATAELARWEAWLETQGVGDLTLVGHSRGANQIARYVLEEQPATARRLVLIAPPRWTEEGTERAYAARHGAALTPLRDAAQQMVDADNGAALLPQPAGLLYCADARVSAESFLSYYRPDPLRDTPTLLARITLPTLVIAGSEDSIATDLPGAFDDDLLHVRVEEIDGADHFFRDLYADELVEIAIDFIHEYDD